MATSNPTANWGGPRSRPTSAATASTDGVAVKHETDLQPGAAIHGARSSPKNPSPSRAAAVAPKKKAGSAKPSPTSPPTPHPTTGPTGEFKARVAATTATTTPKTHSTKGAKTAPAAAVERKGVSAAGLAVRLDADASAVRSSLEAAMVGQNVAIKWRKMSAAAASPPSPKPIGRQQQQQQRGEARGAQSRAAEQRQLELDLTKEIVGALARVLLVRAAIRDKLLPLLDACAADTEASDRKGAEGEGDEGKEGGGDDGEASGGTDDDAEAVGKAVSLLSATTLAEFVPLREFCTACWFVEPTNISDERHARERAAARLSNKMRGLGVTRLVAHPTVSRCIALRESKQTVHTRWCTLGDAIRIAAVGPSCPARYPGCESLVKQLERAAKSRAVVAFLAVRAAETERLDGGGGGGSEGGADTQEGATNTGDATFFIPLSLFADVPRTPRGAAVKPPQEQQRRRNLQALSEIDDRSARDLDSSASASSSSPSLAADDDTDTEPEDNGGNRARRSDSPKKEDGVQDGKLKAAAKSADRGPAQRLKRRAPRQGGGDDDDDDDRVSVDPNPVVVAAAAAAATIENKAPARAPAVAVANRDVKKTSMVAAATAATSAAIGAPSSARQVDRPVKRDKKRRTIESEEPAEHRDAESAAPAPMATVAMHRVGVANRDGEEKEGGDGDVVERRSVRVRRPASGAAHRTDDSETKTRSAGKSDRDIGDALCDAVTEFFGGSSSLATQYVSGDAQTQTTLRRLLARELRDCCVRRGATPLRATVADESAVDLGSIPDDYNAEYRVFVRRSIGRTCEYLVRQTDMVGALKTQIESREGVPADAQILVFGAQRLEYFRTLAEYGIGVDASVDMSIAVSSSSSSSSHGFPVVAKMPSGNKVSVDVAGGSDTVASFKAKILDKSRVSPDGPVRLTFAGRRLQDAHSLAEYRIGRDAVIHVAYRAPDD